MVSIVRPVTVDVVAERVGDRQVLLGAGEGDIEQPPLLFEPVLVAQRHVGWQVAVCRMAHCDRPPLATFGRVNGGDRHVLVVEVGFDRVITGSLRWVEDEFGEESRPLRIRRRGHGELVEIGQPCSGVAVLMGEHGLAEQTQPIDLDRGPAIGRRRQIHAVLPCRAQQLRVVVRGDRQPDVAVEKAPQRGVRVAPRDTKLVEHPGHRGRPDSRKAPKHPTPRQLVAWVVEHTQQRHDVFDVRSLEELEPPVLHERNVPPSQLQLEVIAVMTGAKEHRLIRERDPLFT